MWICMKDYAGICERKPLMKTLCANALCRRHVLFLKRYWQCLNRTSSMTRRVLRASNRSFRHLKNTGWTAAADTILAEYAPDISPAEKIRTKTPLRRNAAGALTFLFLVLFVHPFQPCRRHDVRVHRAAGGDADLWNFAHSWQRCINSSALCLFRLLATNTQPTLEKIHMRASFIDDVGVNFFQF